MRFEEKIAAGRVGRFAVIFGQRGYAAAVAEAAQLGVRDVFHFLNADPRAHPRLPIYRVKLQYFDYEGLNFEKVNLWLNPPWRGDRGWNLKKWPAEEVVRLDAERRVAMEEFEANLFDARFCVELELPYRLGPLVFLPASEVNDPYSTRIEIAVWPETLQPQLKSVADRLGTQVVFAPEFQAGWVVASPGPKGVRIANSHRAELGKMIEPMSWAKGMINMIGVGTARARMVCVCDLEKEEVFWVRYEGGR
jgi:hypothetical protein